MDNRNWPLDQLLHSALKYACQMLAILCNYESPRQSPLYRGEMILNAIPYKLLELKRWYLHGMTTESSMFLSCLSKCISAREINIILKKKTDYTCWFTTGSNHQGCSRITKKPSTFQNLKESHVIRFLSICCNKRISHIWGYTHVQHEYFVRDEYFLCLYAAWKMAVRKRRKDRIERGIFCPLRVLAGTVQFKIFMTTRR